MIYRLNIALPSYSLSSPIEGEAPPPPPSPTALSILYATYHVKLFSSTRPLPSWKLGAIEVINTTSSTKNFSTLRTGHDCYNRSLRGQQWIKCCLNSH